MPTASEGDVQALSRAMERARSPSRIETALIMPTAEQVIDCMMADPVLGQHLKAPSVSYGSVNLFAHGIFEEETRPNLGKRISDLVPEQPGSTMQLTATCNSQEATPAAASEPGPSTAPPAKRSNRTKAEQGKAAKAKPAPQPGRWLDRDCNAALNTQRIGESRWRRLELCWWPEQGKLPAKGKEYPGLGYKRLRDKPPKAQQQQQPAVAQ
ncbi:E2_bind domain-containing protein, partial [Haematococcus lacustris]